MSYYRGVACPIYYEEDPGDPQVITFLSSQNTTLRAHAVSVPA